MVYGFTPKFIDKFLDVQIIVQSTLTLSKRYSIRSLPR